MGNKLLLLALALFLLPTLALAETWEDCLATISSASDCNTFACSVTTVNGLPVVNSTPVLGIHLAQNSFNFLCGVDGAGASQLQVANLSGSELYAVFTSNIDIGSYTFVYMTANATDVTFINSTTIYLDNLFTGHLGLYDVHGF